MFMSSSFSAAQIKKEPKKVREFWNCGLELFLSGSVVN